MKRKLLIALLLLSLLLSTFMVPVLAQATTPVVYLALGDSIGTGSTSRGTTKSYAHSFREALVGKYGAGNVTSYIEPVNGATSGDLLRKVNDAAMAVKISDATVITIYIGGNNVLKAGKNFFSTIDTTIAKKGVLAFQSEYPKILERIRILNKTARIISATLYNPYNIGSVSGYSNNSNLQIKADGYITQINSCIKAYADPAYITVDIYTLFKGFATIKQMGTYTYFYPTSWLQIFRDPHPTQAGQTQIFMKFVEYLP